MIELLTEVARSVARTVGPLGSGRSMVIWNLGSPRDASLAMAAATASLQGMRAEILHDSASGQDIADYVKAEPMTSIVVSLPCHVGADEAVETLTALRRRVAAEHLIFCVAPTPEVFARVEEIRGLEVSANFRDLAELIDTNRS